MIYVVDASQVAQAGALDAEQLFAALVSQIKLFRAQSTLSTDDLRQELHIFCLEVASGCSAYDPRIGSVETYIMGRMWGLIRRWHKNSVLELACTEGASDEAGSTETAVPLALQSSSVLDQIIEVEERRAQESELEAEERRRIKRGRKLPSAVVLAQLGLSHSKIAELTGVSRQAVRQQVARARDDVHHHCFK